MAERIWNSVGSTDMNDGANYSGSGPLLITDDLVFNNTSVINSIATSNINVQSITVASIYTGAWSISGFTATVSLGMSFDGTGSLNIGNGCTINGASSTFHIGVGVGTITSSSCQLNMNTSTAGVVDVDKAITIKCLCINGIVTNSGAATLTVYQGNGVSNPLQIANNSTFTNNQTITLRTAGTVTLWSIGSTNVTFNGTGQYNIEPLASNVVSIPITSYIGSGTFFLANSTGGTVGLSGSFSWNGLTIIRNGAANTFTFNTNNYDFTVNNDFRNGINASGSTLNLNLGSSIVTVTSWNSGALYNTGIAANINLGTSTITCKGNFVLGSLHVVTPGTSKVTFTTNNASLTTAGESFYDLEINASGKIITLSDNGNITGNLIVNNGTLDTSVYNLNVSINTEINGTSTLKVSGSICTFGNNFIIATDAILIIDAVTTFLFTANGAILTTNGKTMPQCTFNSNFVVNDGCTFVRLIRGNDGFTGTFEAGQVFTFSNLTTANWEGSLGNLNYWQSSSSGIRTFFVLPASIELSYQNAKDISVSPSIISDDGTSVDSGNNLYWVFTALECDFNYTINNFINNFICQLYIESLFDYKVNPFAYNAQNFIECALNFNTKLNNFTYSIQNETLIALNFNTKLNDFRTLIEFAGVLPPLTINFNYKMNNFITDFISYLEVRNTFLNSLQNIIYSWLLLFYNRTIKILWEGFNNTDNSTSIIWLNIVTQIDEGMNSKTFVNNVKTNMVDEVLNQLCRITLRISSKNYDFIQALKFVDQNLLANAYLKENGLCVLYTDQIQHISTVFDNHFSDRFYATDIFLLYNIEKIYNITDIHSVVIQPIINNEVKNTFTIERND